MKKRALLLLLTVLLLLPLMSLGEDGQVIIAGTAYDRLSETLDLSHVSIRDVQALEDALLQMPGLTNVDLSYCGLDNETLAGLRERLGEKGIKVVWTLKFGRWTCRTDATAFSTLNDSNTARAGDDVLRVLRYCTDLEALDLGHNWMFDVSWLEPLTQLKVVILSDNRISDISCLAGKPLEYLEMFNNRVSDISFLADCETLIDLNLCNTHVSDLSPLYHLPNLKRVWMGDIKELTKAEITAFLYCQEENLEDYNFFTKYPTEYGWRKHDRYEIIKAMFKEGVYMPFDTVLGEDQHVRLNNRY